MAVATSADAKPVIIGFKDEINTEIIDEYTITNYIIHKKIDAISADVPDSTCYKLKSDEKILYVEDDVPVHIEKKVLQPIQEAD